MNEPFPAESIAARNPRRPAWKETEIEKIPPFTPLRCGPSMRSRWVRNAPSIGVIDDAFQALTGDGGAFSRSRFQNAVCALVSADFSQPAFCGHLMQVEAESVQMQACLRRAVLKFRIKTPNGPGSQGQTQTVTQPMRSS